MPNVDKLIEKMKQQPNGMRPEEIDKVLTAYDYLPVRQKGSHKHYLHKKNRGFDNNKTRKSIKKSLCRRCAE